MQDNGLQAEQPLVRRVKVELFDNLFASTLMPDEVSPELPWRLVAPAVSGSRTYVTKEKPN